MRDWLCGAGLLMVGVDTPAAAELAASMGADILDLSRCQVSSTAAESPLAALREVRRRFPDLGVAIRVRSTASARAAALAGADVLDAGHGVDPALVALAVERQAALVCPPERVKLAISLGQPRDRLAVAGPPVRSDDRPLITLRTLVATGIPVLAPLDGPGPLDGPERLAEASRAPEPGSSDTSPDASLVAATAISAWLGVRIHRTNTLAEVHQLRQTLDMVASIRGDRPPAVARRALG